jgi:hypothetical protein
MWAVPLVLTNFGGWAFYCLAKSLRAQRFLAAAISKDIYECDPAGVGFLRNEFYNATNIRCRWHRTVATSFPFFVRNPAGPNICRKKSDDHSATPEWVEHLANGKQVPEG